MERVVHLKKSPVTDPGNWGELVPRGDVRESGHLCSGSANKGNLLCCRTATSRGDKKVSSVGKRNSLPSTRAGKGHPV